MTAPEITIPREALDKAADEVADNRMCERYCERGKHPEVVCECRSLAFHSGLAMLKNWPWKKYGTHHRHDVSIPFVMLSMAEVPNDND